MSPPADAPRTSTDSAITSARMPRNTQARRSSATSAPPVSAERSAVQHHPVHRPTRRRNVRRHPVAHRPGEYLGRLRSRRTTAPRNRRQATTAATLATFASEYNFPATACEPGKRYRARVRMKDTTGRWSFWSNPIEFTAGTFDPSRHRLARSSSAKSCITPPTRPPPNSAVAAALTPPQLWDDDSFDYLELRNVSANPVDLTGLQFTQGIDFVFPAGHHARPRRNILVVQNLDAFNTRYGTGRPVAGAWQATDKLGNGGDTLTLQFGQIAAPVILVLLRRRSRLELARRARRRAAQPCQHRPGRHDPRSDRSGSTGAAASSRRHPRRRRPPVVRRLARRPQPDRPEWRHRWRRLSPTSPNTPWAAIRVGFPGARSRRDASKCSRWTRPTWPFPVLDVPPRQRRRGPDPARRILDRPHHLASSLPSNSPRPTMATARAPNHGAPMPRSSLRNSSVALRFTRHKPADWSPGRRPYVGDTRRLEGDTTSHTTGVTPITMSNFAANSPALALGTGAKSTVTAARCFSSVMLRQMPSFSLPG